MVGESDTTNSYRVEVSGWDAAENFFVGKTTLEWAGNGRKEVTLHCPLRQGAIVFVRLLQPISEANSFPIAYQAIRVHPNDASGRTRVTIEQLRPRPAIRSTSLLHEKRIHVA